jgi:hypothetical protein
VRTEAATRARRGGENEDHVLVGDGLVLVLDGAGVPAGEPTGCVHGLRWFVTRLADELAAAAVDRRVPLTSALRRALSATAAAHGGRCDLQSPRSPSSTLVAVREQPAGFDWLVLGDSTLVLDEPSALRVISDDRLARVAQQQRTALRRESAGDVGRWRALVDAERNLRNRTGGWWIAAGDPAAADHALTGTSDAGRAVLLSDGAARPVAIFQQFSWQECVDLIATRGPEAWLDRVRELEQSDPDRRRWPRSKTHDDATTALVRR